MGDVVDAVGADRWSQETTEAFGSAFTLRLLVTEADNAREALASELRGLWDRVDPFTFKAIIDTVAANSHDSDAVTEMQSMLDDLRRRARGGRRRRAP